MVKGLEPAGPHLCRPPLMRGLLGPKGLGVFAHPLLLGLHSCIVPGCAEDGHQSRPPGPALTTPPPPHPRLPLCVEGASRVQQQEELPLGLGAVPREEIMLQRHGAGGSADHVDLAALQSSEREGNRSGGGWEGAAHIPTHFPPLASPSFLGAGLGCCPRHRLSQHPKWSGPKWAMFPRPTPAPPPPRPGHAPCCGSPRPTPNHGRTTAPSPSTRDTHLTQSSQQIQGRWGQWHSEG